MSNKVAVFWPGDAREIPNQLALPNVQDRIVAILRSLAQVCGRVRRDGVLIPLRLTHTRLGEMTAARRPTVSLALRDLASAGVVVRLPEGWLLTADAQTPEASVALAAPELVAHAATA